MSRLTNQDIQRVMDFMAGAKWWEVQTAGATMWQEDQNRACKAAEEYLKSQVKRAAAYAEQGKTDPILELKRQQIKGG